MGKPSAGSMHDSLLERLRRIEALSERMLELADESELGDLDVETGILLGTLRDNGYKLRHLVRERLPAGAQAGAVPEPVAEGDVDARPPVSETVGKRVLIVDDDPDVVTYLETWFADRGFHTLRATSGAQALERARSDAPDLITLDITMPDESGTKVYRQLQADERLRATPVIVITAVSSRPLASFGTALDGYLVKPIDMQALGRLVKRLLASRIPGPVQPRPGGAANPGARPSPA